MLSNDVTDRADSSISFSSSIDVFTLLFNRCRFIDMNDITNTTIDYLRRCGMPNLIILELNECPEITDEMLLQIVDDNTNFPLLTSRSNVFFELRDDY